MNTKRKFTENGSEDYSSLGFSDALLIAYVGSAAFLTYVCMYAFRKPFTATTFDSVDWSFDLDFKTVLLIAQVIGYATSKFIGIKVISEMQPSRRILALLCLIVVSWLALALLPVLPLKLAWVALFLNGLPLGMIWGLVFSFLEGRRITEAVGAMLCASFVFGSGIVKSVGRWLLLEQGVAELWMPFFTGALFLVPLLIASYLLSRIPPPAVSDIAQRRERKPVYRADRRAFMARYALGLAAMVVAYVLLTVLRDFTDNFAAELWIALGYGDSPEIFALTSLPVSLLVLCVMFSLMFIRDNARALMVNHWLIGFGFALSAISCWMFTQGYISGLVWMIVLNAGLYLSYMPFNCVLFERLVASVKGVANAGFLIYLADSFGYLGSVQILLYKSLAHAELPWTEFVANGGMLCGFLGVLLTLISAVYFAARIRQERSDISREVLV